MSLKRKRRREEDNKDTEFQFIAGRRINPQLIDRFEVKRARKQTTEVIDNSSLGVSLTRRYLAAHSFRRFFDVCLVL